MKSKLDKEDFKPFLQGLIERFDLYAPVKAAEGVSVYQKITRPEEVNFDLLNPQNPERGLLPPNRGDVLLSKVWEKEPGHLHRGHQKRESHFRSPALRHRGLSMIEEVYCGREYTDVYFSNKRKATTIIGMACETPLSTCFCTSTGGSPFGRKGSDILSSI